MSLSNGAAKSDPASRVSLQWLLGRLLVAAVVLGVGWAVIAGLAGYQFGNPPAGIAAVGACYQTTQVDLLVPMYKTTSCLTP